MRSRETQVKLYVRVTLRREINLLVGLAQTDFGSKHTLIKACFPGVVAFRRILICVARLPQTDFCWFRTE